MPFFLFFVSFSPLWRYGEEDRTAYWWNLCKVVALLTGNLLNWLGNVCNIIRFMYVCVCLYIWYTFRLANIKKKQMCSFHLLTTTLHFAITFSVVFIIKSYFLFFFFFIFFLFAMYECLLHFKILLMYAMSEGAKCAFVTNKSNCKYTHTQTYQRYSFLLLLLLFSFE